MAEDPGYVVVASTDTPSGGHQVTVSLPDLRRLTVRVPPGRATSTGIRQAIEAAIQADAARRAKQ